VLRFVFWTLLFLNAALFAYGQGYFGTSAGEHEPERLKRQFNTAKMTMLSSGQAETMLKKTAAAGTAPPAIAAAAAPAPAPAPAAAAYACTEVGPFDAEDARRFEGRLAALRLGERQSRSEVQAQDVTSWLVNIPPQGSKEAADRKATELRSLGVSNFYIMNGDSPLKYAISLGMFKTESGARTLLAELNKQGVHTARITPRGPQATHYVYRLRDLDAAARKRVAGYAERFDGAELTACG
jgi:cell division septation protein DedD